MLMGSPKATGTADLQGWGWRRKSPHGEEWEWGTIWAVGTATTLTPLHT